MPNNNEQQYEPLTFDAIKIGLASPEKIMEWSKGEVTKLCILSNCKSTVVNKNY